MKTILFQGDSITDCKRGDGLGCGYALLTSAKLGFEHPGEYSFINRGISGNRIVDVYARIKADIINLKPDYMSILIGVNDVWHEVDFKNGVDPEKFEKIYCMLIDEIKAALPDIKLMILEPFCLNGAATWNIESQPHRFDMFKAEVKKRAEKARAVAEKYNIKFIPLQEKFDQAAKEGVFDRIFTTNLIYRRPELLEKSWYTEVNMCKYVAYLIDTLNNDATISTLLNPVKRIQNLMDKHSRALAAQNKK